MAKKEKEGEKKESEVKKAAKGLVYGMAMHGMVSYALKTRMHLENLFMLITMGDMLGVPRALAESNVEKFNCEISSKFTF